MIHIKLYVLFIFFFAKILSQKYEHITSCFYEKSSDLESFEFICEPNHVSREFFNDGNTISCQSNFMEYYKERRHKITFRDCSLKRLPVIFKWYTAIRILNVSHTDLGVLLSRNFDYSENLKDLFVSHNQLEELPSSLFTDSRNIQLVDFSSNKIKKIDPMAFVSTKSLRILNLSNNSIESIDVRTFKDLEQLIELNLGANFIENIESELFRGLNNLELLDLHSNRIKILSCDHFAGISHLKILELQHNQLREFNMSCIRGDKPLTINVSNNKLVNLALPANTSVVDASCNEIKFVSSQNLGNIAAFNVSANHIENIPEIIRNLHTELNKLDVSDSVLGKLNITTFANFRNLEVLCLRNTNLSNIQYGTFHQSKLRVLDISRNKLMQINFNMFASMEQKLETFNVAGNMLESLKNLNYVNFPSLSQLYVGGNNFKCEYLGEFLYSWKNKRIIIGSDSQSSNETISTHIDGIKCNDENDIGTKIVNSQETITSSGDRDIQAKIVDNHEEILKSNSHRNIEFLLICILIVLFCLTVISFIKRFNFFYRNQDRSNQHILYIPDPDE